MLVTVSYFIFKYRNHKFLTKAHQLCDLTFDQNLSSRYDIRSCTCFFIRRDKSIKLNFPKPQSGNKLTAIYTTLCNRYSSREYGKAKDSRRILRMTYSSHSLNHRKCVCTCKKWRSIVAYCKESFKHTMQLQNNTAVKMTTRLFQVCRVVLEKLIIFFKNYFTHIAITMVLQKLMEYHSYEK